MSAGQPVLEQDDERGRDDDRGVLGEPGAADPEDLADERARAGVAALISSSMTRVLFSAATLVATHIP